MLNALKSHPLSCKKIDKGSAQKILSGGKSEIVQYLGGGGVLCDALDHSSLTCSSTSPCLLCSNPNTVRISLQQNPLDYHAK